MSYYICPSCDKPFGNMLIDYKFRSATEEDGDTEIQCPGCKRWKPLDWYVWKAGTLRQPGVTT